MNCKTVQSLLGQFQDGELGCAEQVAVKDHLRACAECRTELRDIAELTDLVRSSCEPEPPGLLWDQIDRRLEEPARDTVGRVLATRSFYAAGAVAVLAMAAFLVGWWAHARFRTADPAALIASLPASQDPFINNLLTTSGAEPVSVREVERRVDFRVLTDSRLPDGYCLGGCCLCGQGCCAMVKCKFIRGADQVVLVQGTSDHPIEYGKLPAVQTEVNGRPARIVQCPGGLLAASWQAQGTALSLVGPRDLSELVRLVTFVDQQVERRVQ
jgi:hypothetical protein